MGRVSPSSVGREAGQNDAFFLWRKAESSGVVAAVALEVSSLLGGSSRGSSITSSRSSELETEKKLRHH